MKNGNNYPIYRMAMAKLKHERREDQLFAEWMAACSEAGPASSNQPAYGQPFQRWFKFKEAFSPRFIHECVRNAGTTVRTCVDPFGGSGTTALTCQFMGISPTTIEVNPFLADLIEAKLSSYRFGSLKRDFEMVRLSSRKTRVNAARILAGGPKTLVEPGVADHWIFSRDVADRVLSIRESIENLPSPRNRRLLRICLGGTLLGLSNAIVNGKGRRYRRNWQNREVGPKEVDSAFQVAFSTALGDIQRFADRATNEYVVLRGDCRIRLPRAPRADIAVFSPPYPNSFDYTDIYNIETLDARLSAYQQRQQALAKSHLAFTRSGPPAIHDAAGCLTFDWIERIAGSAMCAPISGTRTFQKW